MSFHDRRLRLQAWKLLLLRWLRLLCGLVELDVNRASRVVKGMLRWMPEDRATAGEPHKGSWLNSSQINGLYE